MQKTAFVAGASGLVGRQLVFQLLENEQYNKVVALVRTPLNITHPRLEERKLSFDKLDGAINDVAGAHFFCCLGTTIKKAGSQEAFARVDMGYVIALAKECVKGNSETFVVVSSIGANPKSNNFYLRTKGLMEQALHDLPLKSILVVRPSLLLGTRKEWRLAEEISKYIFSILGILMVGPLTKYRGIKGTDVAKAMIRLALSGHTGFRIVLSDELRKLAIGRQ